MKSPRRTRHLTINALALALLHAALLAPVCLALQNPPTQTPPGPAPHGKIPTAVGDPVTKAWLLEALRSPKRDDENIVWHLAGRGVAFRMTEADEGELREAGATDALVEAVRKHYRAPLDLKELEELVSLTRQRPPRTTAGDVLAEVKKRGVSFSMTPANKSALRKAGATSALINAARDNYRPRTPSLPVPATLAVDPTLFPTDPRSVPYGDPKTQPSSGPGVGVGTGGGMGTGGGLGPGRGGNTGGGELGGGGPGPGGPIDYTRPFSTRDVTRKALITYRPEPGYTEVARKNNVSGIVRLRMVLHSSGAVRNISVIKGLPDGLTEKAIAAARQIRFTPAQKDGRTVSQWVVMEYNFVLY